MDILHPTLPWGLDRDGILDCGGLPGLAECGTVVRWWPHVIDTVAQSKALAVNLHMVRGNLRQYSGEYNEGEEQSFFHVPTVGFAISILPVGQGLSQLILPKGEFR